MKKILANVDPIKPQYAATLRLVYPAGFYTSFFEGGRIVAQFRDSLAGPILFEADSEDGSILRPGGGEVSVSLPQEATSLMIGISSVVFDFARIEAGLGIAIPGRITWPVVRTVTRDVL